MEEPTEPAVENPETTEQDENLFEPEDQTTTPIVGKTGKPLRPRKLAIVSDPSRTEPAQYQDITWGPRHNRSEKNHQK